MWLERFSGQSSHSTPSPTPNRAYSPAPKRSVQLGPSTLPRRPGIQPRTSSLNAATSIIGSTDSLPSTARLSNGASLRRDLSSAPAANVPDPIKVLNRILGISETTLNVEKDDDGEVAAKPAELVAKVDFGDLSLEEFVASVPSAPTQNGTIATPAIEEVESDKDKFEDLHKSVLACDDVLKSVETYLTSFRADLAAVSSEIEHLQERSSALNNRLDNRRTVEKELRPEVEAFIIPPAVVRKITEGAVDDAWVKALEEFEKRVKAVTSKLKDAESLKAAQSLRPLIDDVSNKAIERIRDYVVAQIKAIRSPNINAQVIQQNSFLRYRGVFAFLSSRNPQLAEEISQAYINTMRWYYGSHFARYRAALNKLTLYTIDASDAIATDPSTKRNNTKGPGATHDPFSLGRRGDILRDGSTSALPAFAAEEDKSVHHLELPFRAFNLALVDNASAEYAFLTEFFAKQRQSFHTTNRQFNDVFSQAFQLGQELTKSLVEASCDALGLLLCVRQTQRFAFELQRRKVPAAEGYINATNMLLWPRFQKIIDMHCESIRKLTASLPGKPPGSALSLTGSAASSAASSTAPHPLTQRFAHFVHGILAMSSEAGDDEPVANSLGRLRSDFEAFLLKSSKGVSTDARKRERFLSNNYSLVGTILGDTEGRLADDMKSHFEELKDGLSVD